MRSRTAGRFGAAGVIIAVFVAVMTPAAATAAPEGIGIKLIPGGLGSPSEQHSRYIRDVVAPSQSTTRIVTIDNTAAVPQAVTMAVGPAHIIGDAFDFSSAEPNELQRWTSLSETRLSIPAGGTANVQVTIAVPAGTESGERYGVVWASATSATQPGRVSVVNRVGVRVYLAVPGPSGPVTDFSLSPPALAIAGGASTVQSTVRNTGDRALDVSGTVRLTDGPAGAALAPLHTRKALTLAPGATGILSVPLPSQIPAGRWTARTTASSSDLNREAEAVIHLHAATQPSTPSPASSLPKVLSAAFLLTAALAVTAGIITRRRRSRPEAP